MCHETPIPLETGRRRRATAPTAPVEIPPPAAPALPPAEVRALEAIETEAWTELFTGGEEAIRARAGVGLARIGGLLAASAASYDVLALNRVIGRAPDDASAIDPATLDLLLDHYRLLGVRRAFLPWPPPPPGARAGWELDRRGIRPYNRWIKLARDAAPAPPVRSELVAEPLGAGDRAAFEEVLAAGFGDWPRPVAALWGALVGRPGWHCFGVRRRGRMVAVGGLLIRGGAAWFGPAATAPDHRGGGAQKVLLAARIETARAAGCRRLVVETAEPAPDRPVPSFHNVLRMGFEIAYRRENYLLHV